jgi:hypothetical protein
MYLNTSQYIYIYNFLIVTDKVIHLCWSSIVFDDRNKLLYWFRTASRSKSKKVGINTYVREEKLLVISSVVRLAICIAPKEKTSFYMR